jgi:hypothetical protein
MLMPPSDNNGHIAKLHGSYLQYPACCIVARCLLLVAMQQVEEHCHHLQELGHQRALHQRQQDHLVDQAHLHENIVSMTGI